ncbi:unnamed protein product [Haemonchus placei]|uniref:Nucleotid_trans domain-containing protein n=1 Tax=Haemonchus placei TaxID=6290 RepID=A0A0N4X2I0_HAEPC|nr:unnamed protein product [Haemonchus placei]
MRQPSLPENLENRRYIVYQLVLMLRAHIAAVLSSRGISFWSMQQDSLWTENFVSMEVEKHYPHSQLIFDTVGNDQVRQYSFKESFVLILYSRNLSKTGHHNATLCNPNLISDLSSKIKEFEARQDLIRALIRLPWPFKVKCIPKLSNIIFAYQAYH